MSENTKETEVSNTPYLANPIEYTEEPQAKHGLGGHAVPTPGHLRVLSPKGVGERPGKSKPGNNQAEFEETPPDADLKVVAGGGTVGPDGKEVGAEVTAKTAKKTTAKKKPAGAGAGDKTSKKGN